MRPQVGQVINNKYRLLRLIGDGGMGSVFEARHEVLGTTVALKFLHPELSRRAGLVQRFLQEARISAQIKSPHVVGVADVDQNQNAQAFIVMEYLEGKTLQTLYEELYHSRQRLSYADALEYSMQMLEGVEAAHSAGVVHRDLKPDNVIITRGKRGEPILKLLDFGIAKLKVTGQLDRGLTRPGIIMGTPEYMAPEQAYSADAVDARADIFSLGVMIFEMLAGRRPVGGDEPHQIATAYLTRNIAKLNELAPHVPMDLTNAIHRAMGPKPDDRFSSVAELRAAIEPFWLATKPAVTPMPPGASSLTPAPAPAASPVAGSIVDGLRRVPKTLPPESESPKQPQGTSQGQSVEVVFSQDPSSLAPSTTPVSKAPSFDEVGATPQPAGDPPSVVVAGQGNAPMNGAAAFAGTVESPPLQIPPAPALDASTGQPGTVEAAPILMGGHIGGGNGRSTASMPMGMGGQMPERAGGTAVGAPMFQGGAGSTVAPGYGQGGMPGGTENAPYLSPAGGMPPTASMDPAPYAPSPPTRQRQRPQRSTAASFALILFAATGIAGAVVGGIWYAQQRAKEQDLKDDPPAVSAPPVASVTSEPTIPTTPAKVPTAQPPVVVSHPQVPVGPKPTNTPGGPIASGQPSASPSAVPTAFPTTFPTSFPTALPTIPTSLIQIPLPTSLPFPFPPPQQQQQPPQPSQPTPQPSTTTPKPHPPIILHKNGREVHITLRRPRRTQPNEPNTSDQDQD